MNESNDSRLVTGLFPDRDSAEAAYAAATERGYSKNDVNLVMSDKTRTTHFGEGGVETELGNKAAKGAGVGGAIGDGRRLGRRRPSHELGGEGTY